MPRLRIVPYVPYLVVTIVHLVSLLVHDVFLSSATKPLLMPLLLLALVWITWAPRGLVVALTALALVLSWVGDVLLATPGDLGFLLGLGGFLLAHVTYLVLFLRRAVRVRRVPAIALVLVLWWVVLVIVLMPYLHALVVPVAVYGLALGGSTAAALAANRWITVGGLAFLVSDTLLGFRLFDPDFGLPQADFVIMLLYCAAQGLIVVGLTRSVPVLGARHVLPTGAA